MKIEGMPDRIYYYLLDFNDSDNWVTIRKEFNKDKLNQLTKDEAVKLFKIASKLDQK